MSRVSRKKKKSAHSAHSAIFHFADLFFIGNSFPKFWDILEEEMDVNAVDLVEIKSIFCALGFMTKTSVASIKTLKKLISLEAEYIKMRSNVNAFQAVCNKFPALESIESFSSGIIATMNDVIAHLNPKKSQAIPITLDEEGRKSMAEATQKAIVKQAKQVSLFIF